MLDRLLLRAGRRTGIRRSPDVFPAGIGANRATRFTVNAMAIPLNGPAAGSLLDPCGGRQTSPGASSVLHPRSPHDDHPRLSGRQFALRLGFRIEPQTRAWIEAARPPVPSRGQRRPSPATAPLFAEAPPVRRSPRCRGWGSIVRSIQHSRRRRRPSAPPQVSQRGLAPRQPAWTVLLLAPGRRPGGSPARRGPIGAGRSPPGGWFGTPRRSGRRGDLLARRTPASALAALARGGRRRAFAIALLFPRPPGELLDARRRERRSSSPRGGPEAFGVGRGRSSARPGADWRAAWTDASATPTARVRARRARENAPVAGRIPAAVLAASLAAAAIAAPPTYLVSGDHTGEAMQRVTLFPTASWCGSRGRRTERSR